MSKNEYAKIKLIKNEEKKELTCEFINDNLKECIDIKNFEQFSLESSIIVNDAILRCLKTMIITCIKNRENIEVKFSLINVDLVLKKMYKNVWRIDSVNLKLDPNIKDKSVLKTLEPCFKFFNNSCISEDHISFDISYSKSQEALGHYKTELNRLKEDLEKILGRELNIESEEL